MRSENVDVSLAGLLIPDRRGFVVMSVTGSAASSANANAVSHLRDSLVIHGLQDTLNVLPKDGGGGDLNIKTS